MLCAFFLSRAIALQNVELSEHLAAISASHLETYIKLLLALELDTASVRKYGTTTIEIHVEVHNYASLCSQFTK